MAVTQVPTTLNIPVTCSSCKKELVAKVKTDSIDPLLLAPPIRGGITPVSTPYEYHVTSEDIKRFITDVCHQYSPNAQLNIGHRYCEKKRRKPGEVHHAYASFMIGFSHHVIDGYDENRFFEKLGESEGRVNVIRDLYVGLIQRWSYDKRQIDEWLKSYKKLEVLEEGLGMTEAFINEIKKFSVPRSAPVNGSKDQWVFFMASPEKILMDFFTNSVTNKIAGKIEIKDVNQLSKDMIEYTIIVDPYVTETKENPHVRQILNGDEKI